MHRWPMSRRRGQKAFQPDKSGGSSQPDPQRVAIVLTGHPEPTRKLLVTKGLHRVIPSYAEKQRDGAQVQRTAEENADANASEKDFQRDRGLIRIQKVRQAVA